MALLSMIVILLLSAFLSLAPFRITSVVVLIWTVFLLVNLFRRLLIPLKL